jgi:predicted transcriptional regulator
MVRLGRLERVVMECLWADDQPLTVREVYETLLATRHVAYTTVATTLRRLARKGFVAELRDERAYGYRATATREQMFHTLLADAVGVVGDRTGVLVRFVEGLGPVERQVLREALDREVGTG